MKFQVESEERLDLFLVARLPETSRSKLARHIENGLVFVEGKTAKPGLKLKVGWEVEVLDIPESAPHDLVPADIPLDVRYEDDSLLVVNKPRDLASHPASTLKVPSLVNALLYRGNSLSTGSKIYRPGIVHRLDKGTTGLIMIAKNDAVHANLSQQIQFKNAERKYLAVVIGKLDQDSAKIEGRIGRDPKNRLKMAITETGKPAATHLNLVQLVELPKIGAVSLVELRLETGRTHQIRVHLSAINHAVLGDQLYASRELHGYPLQLHAYFLAFDHPVSGERMEIRCEPPYDFLIPEPI